ncbi:Holliday junction branch migration protein RuvA [Geitlerinema splendidum]|jgi:Holliday junction DNA helicase RuvA|nr:Holliday junction branch migration protein RuvA [Geitlerinema splendidum]
MIAKLTGIIDTLGDTFAVLDVSGVGYLVSCSSRTLGQLGSRGDKAVLYIETVMRAESLQLYGFASAEEQTCFRLLTTVQGVGMKMGLALLSALSPSDLYQAIATQDKETLTRADGVGPKLASRMITELKDKVPSESGFSATLYSHPSSMAPVMEEAVSALVNLGYRRIEAVTAVSKAQQQCGENVSLNDLIRQGLSLMSRTGT